MIASDGARRPGRAEEGGMIMLRRAAMLARIALVPVGVAVGTLMFAVPARAADSDDTPLVPVVQPNPVIGSGTHPVEGQAETAVPVLLLPVIGSGTDPVEDDSDSWGVGNG
jgi:hypothetical protein